MKEIWKTIKGFKSYQVSNKGQVKSVRRKIRNRWGWRWADGCLHKQKTRRGTHPYKSVGLRKISGGRKKFLNVHRLVAAHFIRPLRKHEVVNHLDHDPANNCVTNLEITTPKGNMQHAKISGRLTRGTRHHSNKLSESTVLQIRAIHSTGIPIKKLAPSFGISDTMMYKIVNLKSWTHV